MKFTRALSLPLAVGFTQTAARICRSQCTARWKDGTPGIDIKFYCAAYSSECGSVCSLGTPSM
jgi:hypothetical protein